jgi:hypothetical protein
VHQQQIGGQVTITVGSGVTLATPPGRLPKTRCCGSVIRLSNTGGGNAWAVTGDLAYDISAGALATSGTIAITPTAQDIDVYTITPSGAATLSASGAPANKRITLVVTTSGTTSFTLTFGTGFKTTGTLATGTVTAKVFTISFIGDGTNFNETSRTTAM